MEAKLNSPLISDLVRLLGVMRLQQQQLLDCIESKLEAVRRADVPAMQELHRTEAELVEAIRERDGLRRQLMDRIACELGWPAGAGRALHISKLALRVTGADRYQLLDAAKELRDVALCVQRVNRVAGTVSRELLNHLGNVFASVVATGKSPVGYSGDGSVVCRSDLRVFEAVG